MRVFKNIRKPKHTIFTHCFVFFVDNGKKEETFILRDLDTDFEGLDYDKYIDTKVSQLYSRYKENVQIEGNRLGLWEYNELLQLGVTKF